MAIDRFALGANLGAAQRERERRAQAVAAGVLSPHESAMSEYAGPSWGAFFGSLNEQEAAANEAGKNFRVGWGGFGNSTSAGGSMPRGRTSLGYTPDDVDPGELNPLERQSQKYLMLQQQANALTEQAKQEMAAQQAYNDAQSDRVQGRLNQSYDNTVLASTLMPTAQGTDLERIERLPAHLRLALKGPLQGLDIAARKQKDAEAGTELDKAKLAEVVRANKASESLQAGSMMSPDAIEQNARLYLQTGTMPPLGMRDPNNRQRILNRAAELSAGGGGNIAANKADYKADAGSLSALQKQRDTIGAFEQTAMKNIDIFLDQAGKVVDTGSPLANVVARTVSGKMLGSPDQAAYDAARQVAINEIAKITSNPNLSGQLSDSARHEVEAFNPQSATLKQSVAVMRLLKQDMGNRISSLDEAISGIKSRIAPTPPAPDAAPARANPFRK